MKRLLFDWMKQVEFGRMKCLPVHARIAWIVEKVTNQGMTNIFHMNPNLMGAPSFQL